jgi:polysaccharide pyruvyl transferase WcaK-like protein
LEVGVAISVRLHGALQAINAGIPTIHLSYERKGYGAYTDLGIKKWVHSVHDFSPETVADQARELLRDPSEYWARIHDQVETLKTYEIELVERIRVIRGAK